ncbi:hypothetical protein Q3G72_011888 [Acer saccharum]|nr:hypothetical protein Q3G72_011888 [Acer saccharum]
MASRDLSVILPRVLIVSRRCVRKNKFVDFVGEYHLDLIVGYGAVPVIVPRVNGVHMLLDSFEPIHGVLLCEGEDIDPSLYEAETSGLSHEELEEIRRLHASDTSIDKEKDSIELSLAKLCLERNIPYLGICRGSQVLNVACGGTLYQDIEKELSKNCPENQRVSHIDYDNYDNHRHVSNTALSLQQEKRLKQMGATVRNGGSYIERLKLNEEREKLARNVIGKMSVEQLSDVMSFYMMMGQICSEVLERKLQAGLVNDNAS